MAYNDGDISPGSMPTDVKVNIPSFARNTIIMHQHAFEEDYGVILDIPASGSASLLGVRNAVLVAEFALANVTKDSKTLAKFKTDMQKKSNVKVHVFVDYSNISISAGNGAKLDAAALVQKVIGLRQPVQRVVAGSVALDSVKQQLTAEWRNQGFQAHFPKRAPGQGEGDMGIDETLVSAALSAINGSYRKEERHTLVLVTGDGNLNKGMGVSFIELADKALQKGWRVELWSWSHTTSQNYARLSQGYPGHFQRHQLDIYREKFVTMIDPARLSCPARAHGTAGCSGSASAAGRSGSAGAAGRSGSAGASGPSGSAGAAGPSGMAGTTGPSSLSSQPKLCNFFGKGQGCRFGSSCKYRHAALPASVSLQADSNQQQIVCLYFNTTNGCRYGDTCRYVHGQSPPDASEDPGCPVCYESKQYWQFACGHKICKDCGDRVLARPRKCCPICMVTVDRLLPRYN